MSHCYNKFSQLHSTYDILDLFLRVHVIKPQQPNEVSTFIILELQGLSNLLKFTVTK